MKNHFLNFCSGSAGSFFGLSVTQLQPYESVTNFAMKCLIALCLGVLSSVITNLLANKQETK